MACGEYGPGRMSEPAAILAAIDAALEGETLIPLPASAGRTTKPLAGCRVVVTSGPTHEPIDPVRYIGNRSSGKQGHAIAAAAARAGAEVILVSGPVALLDPPGVVTAHVETAAQMLAAVETALPADIFIAHCGRRRLARRSRRAAEGEEVPLPRRNSSSPKIPIFWRLSRNANPRVPRLVVGFAAETENLLVHAREKLQRKHCDLIVANDVGEDGAMGKDENEVTLISAAGTEPWPKMRKDEIAAKLVWHLAHMLKERRDV